MSTTPVLFILTMSFGVNSVIIAQPPQAGAEAAISFSMTAQAARSVDGYISHANKLIAAHQGAVTRLAAPAKATADALATGGTFYLNNTDNPAWFYEGIGRAGGLMQVQEFTLAATPHPNDVVWISYTASTYQNALKLSTQLSSNKVIVVAFGPQPPAGAPVFPNWVDSLTLWTAKDELTLFGNVLSLWTLEGELAAAEARQGKSLVFWQSILAPGGPARNAHYTNQLFHNGFPQMEPVQAGEVSAAYLKTVAALIAEITRSELSQIAAAGRLMAQLSAAGNPPALVVSSHILPFIHLESNTLFQYVADSAKLDQVLARGGFLVDFGYSGIDLELWRKVRLAGANALWITGELPNQADFSGRGDLLINQHWDFGDASVTVPGYDVRILPVSGVAQLFIYGLLVRAASEK